MTPFGFAAARGGARCCPRLPRLPLNPDPPHPGSKRRGWPAASFFAESSGPSRGGTLPRSAFWDAPPLRPRRASPLCIYRKEYIDE